MGGLLLIGLLILLVVKLWPFFVAAAVLFLIWRFVIAPANDARAREVRERLRHERARQEIERIASETTRAMYTAATRSGEIIEGHAEEVQS